MDAALFGHKVSFVMNGEKFVIPTDRHLTQDEFCPMLYYTRRLLGYVVYPRWFMTRLYLAEVIEMFKRNGIYKHELKKAVKNLLHEFDVFENKHKRDFNQELVEVMASNLSVIGLQKINDIRGAIGGVLMNHGIKQYVLYSYPYTFMNMCFDNTVTFEQCMNQVKIKYGVDFTKVFAQLEGTRLYYSAIKVMKKFVEVMGEKVNNISFEGSGCLEKLHSLSNALLDEGNLRKAFQEACDEVPPDEKEGIMEEMSLWYDEKDDIREKLSEKFNVTPLK
jgi:hypothetical protein